MWIWYLKKKPHLGGHQVDSRQQQTGDAAPLKPSWLLLVLRLGLEAKHRGSWCHGGRPGCCLHKPQHLAMALLSSAADRPLASRWRQQGQIRLPSMRKCWHARAHNSLERQEIAVALRDGELPLVLLLRSQSSKLLGYRSDQSSWIEHLTPPAQRPWCVRCSPTLSTSTTRTMAPCQVQTWQINLLVPELCFSLSTMWEKWSRVCTTTWLMTMQAPAAWPKYVQHNLQRHEVRDRKPPRHCWCHHRRWGSRQPAATAAVQSWSSSGVGIACRLMRRRWRWRAGRWGHGFRSRTSCYEWTQ